MEEHTKIARISRKKFLYWLLPIGGATAIVFSFKSIYSGFMNTLISKYSTGLVFGPRKNKKRQIIREVWSRNSLILNTKTNIVHYPASELVTYYNRIADKHIQVIGFQKWKEEVIPPKHFIKSKSGIIFEQLALKELSIPLSPENLQKATDILAMAFSEEYMTRSNYQINTCNWRLYHLLGQFLALNTSIPLDQKWVKFAEIIKSIDFKFIKVDRRNSWVKSQSEFNKQVQYILAHFDLYSKSIEGRIPNT
jgi:hypothetical protein